MAAFEEIMLRNNYRPSINSSIKSKEKFNGSKYESDSHEKDMKTATVEKKESSDEEKIIKRCYNCGKKSHISGACLDKNKRPKCFGCDEYGHKVLDCPKKEKAETNFIIASSMSNKHNVDVKINNIPISEIFDTGSDLTVMRADEFIRIAAPKLVDKRVQFRGVGTELNTTVGEFNATIMVDGHSYPILINVISDNLSCHKLLIGRDFLDKVDIHVRHGAAKISPVYDELVKNVPEISQIDISNEAEANSIRLSFVKNPKHRVTTRELIDIQ